MTRRTDSERLRDALVAESIAAGREHERAKAAFTAPYSSDTARDAWRIAWGRWCGIAKAIEILDAMEETDAE